MPSMTSHTTRLLLLCTAVWLLSGCQSAFKKLHNQQAKLVLTETEIKDILASTQSKKPHKNRNVAIHCTGLFGCELASIDNTLIINKRANKPYRHAMKKDMVRMQKDDAGNLSYIGLTSAGEHEVRTRFYPVSEVAYESFAVIHDFAADKVYRLHGYRKTDEGDADAMSLLAVAAPKPVCVALFEGRKQVRQFCKAADITTGLGEFVEEQVPLALPLQPDAPHGFQDRFFQRETTSE